MDKQEEREYWARMVRETQRHSRLTIDGLGERLGVTGREVSHWKAGKRRPTGMVAVKFFELRREVLWKAGLLDMSGFIILGTVVHS